MVAIFADRDGIEGTPDNASVAKAAVCIVLGFAFFIHRIGLREINKTP